MDSKTSHFNLNHLQKITTPTTIRTSKNWVLPPRPRPGRKPNASTAAAAAANANSSLSSGSVTTALPSEKPKKTYKKKNQDKMNNGVAAGSNVQFNNNPVELALKKIKDENKVLKLELSKLVSDLKTLQQNQKSCSVNSSSHSSPDCLHKKRNHIEMAATGDFLLDQIMENASDEDDLASQISTPSLVSNNSSIMSHSTSSLSSIQEDEILKIDDFLTTSYFDDNSNSITKEQQNSLKTINPMKSSSNLKSPMLSPPSLPINDTNDNFEFKFLEQENTNTSNPSNFDSLFEISPESNEVFNWDWK